MWQQIVNDMQVERYGFNAQGYVTRAVLIALCAHASRSDRRATIAFLGCGALWSVAESLLVLLKFRTGAATFVESNPILVVIAATARGFSEGGAVLAMAWPAFSFDNIPVVSALGILLFDAALLPDGAELLSSRDVLASFGLVVTLSLSTLYLWRVNRCTNLLPTKIAWRMCATGWMWNAVAILSRSRQVIPSRYTMAFALYDSVFEIAFLYAGLTELVLMLALQMKLLE